MNPLALLWISEHQPDAMLLGGLLVMTVVGGAGLYLGGTWLWECLRAKFKEQSNG